MRFQRDVDDLNLYDKKWTVCYTMGTKKSSSWLERSTRPVVIHLTWSMQYRA